VAVEDDRRNLEPVGVRDGPLGLQPPELLVGIADRAEEDVDRPALVVRRPLDVPGVHAARCEAAEVLLAERLAHGDPQGLGARRQS